MLHYLHLSSREYQRRNNLFHNVYSSACHNWYSSVQHFCEMYGVISIQRLESEIRIKRFEIFALVVTVKMFPIFRNK